MDLKPSISTAIQHIIALLIFSMVVLIYFSPVFEGKVLSTHDGSVFTATSREIANHREEFNEEPLWTNSMFGGMPAYFISTHFPGNFVKPLYNFLRSPGIPLAPIFLLMAGFYFLLIYMYKINKWLAIVGSIAYAFSSYFFIILTAGHNTKAMALAFMAPLIASVVGAYRKNRLIGSALLALFLSLQIISNHLQITYYTLLIILAFGLSELIYSIKEKEISSFIKTTLSLLGAVIVAVLVNFASLYTTYEYTEYSMRGKSELQAEKSEDTGGLEIDYATQWSYGIDETLSFIIPNIKGGASIPFENDSETVKTLRQNNGGQYITQFRQYWGSQNLGTSGPVYIGAIVFFLFIMGLVLVKNRDKWWILIITIIAIMLAWGKNFLPFTSFFFNFFPGYNRFRAITMIMIIAEFCIPLLGILTLDKIFKGEFKKDEFLRALKIAGGITTGILLLYLLIPGIAGSFISQNEAGQIPDWLHNSLVSDRKNMLKADVLRSLILVISSIVVIYYSTKGKIKLNYSILLLGILIIIDMWPVNKRYLNNDNFITKNVSEASFNPSVADNYILQDSEEVRVLNLTTPDPFSDGSTSNYHHSIGGYHGAKIRRYQDLISTSISRDINNLVTKLRSATSFEDMEGAFTGLNALNMLNTKYVIINPQNQPVKNPEALGNAWFVDSYRLVETADDELALINAIMPSKEVIVNNEFENHLVGLNLSLDSLSSIELSDYRANRLSYSSSSATTQLAVFSEIYYPEGWKASINGENLDIIRVNYVLRAAIIPPGNNEIIFEFDPDSYKKGNLVSMGGSILLILLLLLALYFELKKPKVKDAE